MNFKKLFAKRSAFSARRGMTAVGLSALVVAIVIFLNLLVSQLPSNVLEADMTDQRLYEISDISKDYLKTLDQDIQFIILQASGSNDERLSKFIYSYAGLSDRISVVEMDPVVYPSVLDRYGAASDSLVVICEATGKSSVINFYGYGIDSMIAYEFSANAGTFVESSFDADGQITSAIDYVTGNVAYTVYAMTGHGETDLPDGVRSLIIKSNLGLQEDAVDILKQGLPADCDMLICYRPTMDLAADELQLLQEFLHGGGNLVLLTDVTDLENFNTLMREYGLEMQQGYVADPSRYYQQYASYYGYYCFYPRLSNKSDITRNLTSNAILIYPRAMKEATPARRTIDTMVFMATSEDAQLYTDETSYTTGFYALGAMASEQTDGGTAHLTVITAPMLIDEAITSGFSSMSNLSIFINAVTECFDGVNNITIEGKNLMVSYNTVPNTSYILWSIVFIALIPVAVLVTGLVVWLKRRRL